MNVTNSKLFDFPLQDGLRIRRACESIAPTWPLDRLIAVNPLWQMRSEPVETISARLAALANIQCLMPLEFYQELFQQKKISLHSLQKAAREKKVELSSNQLLEFLLNPAPKTRIFRTMAAIADKQRSRRLMSWHDEIVIQISQFCAAYFQKKEKASHQGPARLYQDWLSIITLDQGLDILMSEKNLVGLFKMLPDTVESLLALAINELDLDGDFLEAYAQALLFDINGWASWIAFTEFHEPPTDPDKSVMLDLLAIRMAWELVIWLRYKDEPTMRLKDEWANQKSHLPNMLAASLKAQTPLWIWATALEYEYQAELERSLLEPIAKEELTKPFVQAIFCIDVRSEPIRRALETQDPSIQTLGFAGFFGLPIRFDPAASSLSRPQLPGLIQPQLSVHERQPDLKLRRAIGKDVSWENWSKTAPSAFFMVEAAGIFYLWKLIKRSFARSQSLNPVNRLSQQKEWVVSKGGQELSPYEKAELVGGFLKASGLRSPAPWVLLVGHGSETHNNPQAAALDCGACGGQTGEVNVRVLADLLNDPSVREALITQGHNLDPSTRFVAAFHNTTTDELSVFEDSVDDRVKDWLTKASAEARKERHRLQNPEAKDLDTETITRLVKRKANDWSEVRPEWGLANNAAFIIAPRAWTKSRNLEGRCFLHDYDWQTDTDFALLEVLMTAPMIVTHWINMQYNCSVTDNQKYGTGNKVLHNVVGGTIGIFEGNGGDLRTGLSLQSLHDGKRWMHTPQRLSVYIAAPADAMKALVRKHVMLRELVENGWLYLFSWDEEGIARIQPSFRPTEVHQ